MLQLSEKKQSRTRAVTARLINTAKLFRWSAIILIITVWISAALFGLYILAFYAAALYELKMERWNNILPGLYQKDSVFSTSGIGLHFAAGGIILLLGCIQLMRGVRDRYPALHRWLGVVYVVSSILAAAGGLVFIATKGTIGGTVMNIGFSLYGVLMLMAAVETFRHAKKGNMRQHRKWALRLFALAIGSWLYRMDYGFWFMLAGSTGHNPHFTGPFDGVMAFFFYIPNLLLTEIYLRSRSVHSSSLLNITASLFTLLMVTFLLLGTYYFTKFYWGPAILQWIAH